MADPAASASTGPGPRAGLGHTSWPMPGLQCEGGAHQVQVWGLLKNYFWGLVEK